MKDIISKIFSSLYRVFLAVVCGIVAVALIAILFYWISIGAGYLAWEGPTIFGLLALPLVIVVIDLGLSSFYINSWLGGFFSDYTLKLLGERDIYLSIVSAFIVGAITSNAFRIGLPYLFEINPPPPPLEVQLQLNKILRTSMANGIPSAFLVGLQRMFSPYVLKELELMKEPEE
jgi:hypothetical protein